MTPRKFAWYSRSCSASSPAGSKPVRSDSPDVDTLAKDVERPAPFHLAQGQFQEALVHLLPVPPFQLRPGLLPAIRAPFFAAIYLSALDAHNARVFGRCEAANGIAAIDGLVEQVDDAATIQRRPGASFGSSIIALCIAGKPLSNGYANAIAGTLQSASCTLLLMPAG